MSAPPLRSVSPSLWRLFARFLRFGFLAWGGPVAQIGMIKRELVDEEEWIAPARFNRLLAVYQLLPGPEAHELCVHLGTMRAGRIGGILAGLGFMLPGLILMIALAWLYARIDLSAPLVAATFLAIQVAVVAIIFRAVHRIADHTLTDFRLGMIAVLAAAAAWLGLPFWISLPVAGFAFAAAAAGRPLAAAAVLALGIGAALLAAAGWISSGAAGAGPVPMASEPVSSAALFLSGLKAGLLTFGGAYAAIPFVRGDAVGRGWVSDSEFLDGLALSGIIPAPLIIFATFVGYQAGGLAGALAMTAGIFLPAFAFGLLFHDRLERAVEDERLLRFLEGVAAAVVGLIALTALELAWEVATAVPSPLVAGLIFPGSLALLYLWKSRFCLPAVVLGAAAIGALAGRAGA